MQKLFGVVALMWLAVGFALPGRAATVEEVSKSVRNLAPAPRRAALEEGAKKEGEVIWYTSMSLTDFPKVVGAFEKTYPPVAPAATLWILSAHRPLRCGSSNKKTTRCRICRLS